MKLQVFNKLTKHTFRPRSHVFNSYGYLWSTVDGKQTLPSCFASPLHHPTLSLLLTITVTVIIMCSCKNFFPSCWKWNLFSDPQLFSSSHHKKNIRPRFWSKLNVFIVLCCGITYLSDGQAFYLSISLSPAPSCLCDLDSKNTGKVYQDYTFLPPFSASHSLCFPSTSAGLSESMQHRNLTAMRKQPYVACSHHSAAALRSWEQGEPSFPPDPCREGRGHREQEETGLKTHVNRWELRQFHSRGGVCGTGNWQQWTKRKGCNSFNVVKAYWSVKKSKIWAFHSSNFRAVLNASKRQSFGCLYGNQHFKATSIPNSPWNKQVEIVLQQYLA